MAFLGFKYTNQIPDNSTKKLGAFSGYVRRPKNQQSGLTAQFFGENGEEADMILALSLSKLQDSKAFVNVYLIKDSDGHSFKKEDNSYPCIASFECYIRRSAAAREGMIAQLFATNGPNADQVAELSKTQYQDCLVFVDVRGAFSSKNKEDIDKENFNIIDADYAKKITYQQKKDYQKHEKQYKKLNDILYTSDFLQKYEVIALLGEPLEFKDWLSKQHNLCSIQTDGEPCHNHSNTELIKSLPQPYNYYPVCEQHLSLINSDSHFDNNRYYYQMKHNVLLQSWLKHRLSVLFSIDGNSEPNPNDIIEWANKNKVHIYLPNKYQPII